MRRLMLRLLVAVFALGLGIAASLLYWQRQHAASAPIEVVAPVAPLPPVAPIAEAPRPDPPRPPSERCAEKSPIKGGILDGKTISKPQPTYPAIARAAHADGAVVVEVIVDIDGDVIGAKATSGHPLLQQAAVEAAMRAELPPTLLSGGCATKVSGTLTYDFVLQ